MKRKTFKGIIAGAIAAVVTIGGCTAGYFIWKGTRAPVNVYAVRDVAMTDDFQGDVSSTSGIVETRNMQPVIISDTQTVTEIYVKEGQEVRQGDKLCALDTTLTELELEHQRITLEQTKLNLSRAEKDLEAIQKLRPYYPPTDEPEPEPEPEEELPAEELPYFRCGSGTEELPYVYLWNSECWYTEEFIDSFLPKKETVPDDPQDPEETAKPESPDEPGETTEPEETTAPEETPQPENTSESESKQTSDAEDTEVQYEQAKVWVVFETRSWDNPEGELLSCMGICFERMSDGTFRFRMFTPLDGYDGEVLEEEEPEDDDYVPSYSGSMYSADEIAQMKAEKENEIKELEISVKTEDIKYRRLVKEVSTGVVTAEVDGVIRNMVSEDEARSGCVPLFTVFGGGGYYVTGTLSELELDTVSVGQSVKVIYWGEDYYELTGIIEEISLDPSENSGWTNGNTNVSYYPFTVRITDDAALMDGAYTEIQYTPSQDQNGLYLQMPFVRKEGGTSYVYVKGEDGLLEKRAVQTGEILWQSYTRILSGLSVEDRVAFPYGTEVTEGARTRDAELTDLYESGGFY